MARGNTKGSEVSVKVEYLIFSDVCVSGCLHPQSAPQQPKATFSFSGKERKSKFPPEIKVQSKVYFLGGGVEVVMVAKKETIVLLSTSKSV